MAMAMSANTVASEAAVIGTRAPAAAATPSRPMPRTVTPMASGVDGGGAPEGVRRTMVVSNAAGGRAIDLPLSGEAGVEIVGRAENANVAIQLGRELAPTTVLIDLESLGERGLEEAVEVRRQISATVIVLSLRDDQQSRHRADEAGLRFVSKQAGRDRKR